MHTTKKMIDRYAAARTTLWIVLLAVVASLAAGSLGAVGDPTADALAQALDDERRSEAFYRAVMAEHGEVLPFRHIVEAEVRHQERILMLYDRYGLEVPADRWTEAEAELEVPPTVLAACEAGVASEQANVALYDRLLPNVSEPDVRQVLSRLRAASADHHLPAFERCVAGGGEYAAAGCPGCGSGGRHGAGGRCAGCADGSSCGHGHHGGGHHGGGHHGHGRHRGSTSDGR
jgi:hypothetical protein